MMEYHGTWLHATRPVFFEHYGIPNHPFLEIFEKYQF